MDMIEWLTDSTQLISHTPNYEVIVTGLSPGMTCSVVFLLFIAFLFGLPLVEASVLDKRIYTHRPGPTLGRSSIYITCPFCDQEIKAYVWSLAGSGKKCPCGAKHTWLSGYSYKEIDMQKTNAQIEALIKKVADNAISGPSKFFGMSYEQGIYETARWILGETEDDPYPEE